MLTVLAALVLTASLSGQPVHVPPVALPYIEKVDYYGFRPRRRFVGGAGEVICCGPPPPPPLPGAQLPINIAIVDLPGTKYYVDPAGSDSNNCTTTGVPCATFSRAQSVASNGDTVVFRGGTIRGIGSTWNQGTGLWTSETTISKSLTLAAYPGETPVFDGARAVTAGPGNGWTLEGGSPSLSYISYVDLPVTTGFGIAFGSNCLNQNGGPNCVGQYPDQAWIGTARLVQVFAKASVVDGKFYVDRINDRLYMTTVDSAKADIEVSDKGDWLTCGAANVSLKGLTVERYSETPSRGAVFDLSSSCDANLMEDMALYDSAFMAVFLNGSSSNKVATSVQRRETIDGSNWMGENWTYADTPQFLSGKIVNSDPNNEFSNSPQSGGIKTSRNNDILIAGSQISDNSSQGLWFDQSNERITVANNVIKNNAGSGVFCEISDDFVAINNDITATSAGSAIKLAGCTGAQLWNNTLGGGVDVVALAGDDRSHANCADPSQGLCVNGQGQAYPSSDRIAAADWYANLDWMTRLDVMKNNTFRAPSGVGFCGVTSDFCIAPANGQATTTYQSLIHHADGARGIPATAIDCNVYDNGAGKVIGTQSTDYTLASDFTTFAAGAPISISGLDANSLTGTGYLTADGTPTTTLAALHGNACAIPTDARLNVWLAPGYQHYGVSTK